MQACHAHGQVTVLCIAETGLSHHAEIKHLDQVQVVKLPAEKDVVGLHIAVDQALPVGLPQGVAGAQPVGTDGDTAYERSLQHFGPGVQIIAPGHGSA